MMEPRLLIFHNEESIQQIFVCAENEMIIEVPTNKLIDGFIHLMATYYVFNVEYNFCRLTLLFLQDILLEMPDKKKRPTRYSTYICTSGLSN